MCSLRDWEENFVPPKFRISKIQVFEKEKFLFSKKRKTLKISWFLKSKSIKCVNLVCFFSQNFWKFSKITSFPFQFFFKYRIKNNFQRRVFRKKRNCISKLILLIKFSRKKIFFRKKYWKFLRILKKKWVSKILILKIDFCFVRFFFFQFSSFSFEFSFSRFSSQVRRRLFNFG